MSGSWPKTSLAVRMRSNARLLGLGITAELRRPGLRLLGLVGALGTAAAAWGLASVAPATAIYLTAWLGRIYGVLACLWLGYAANRDLHERDGALFHSKPVDGARWVFLGWAVGVTAWLILLGLAFAAAALAQLPHAGGVSLAAHGWGLLRSVPLVAGPATLAYALSRLMRSPLGGIIVVFAWFCALAGLQYIPMYLQPDLSQNRLLYVGAAAFLLGLAALLVERARRGELRRPLPGVLAVTLLALLAGAGAAQAYRSAPGRDSAHSLGDMISRQYIQRGMRVPGFWLPDGRGGLVRTAPYEGKLLLVYLFAANDLDAARTLPALDRIAREYRDRGVQPIGVCLSPDQGDAAALVRTSGYDFPIAGDPGTLKTAPPESPVAIAYDVKSLPLLVITDRQRRVRETHLELFYDIAVLRSWVEQRLAEEPE